MVVTGTSSRLLRQSGLKHIALFFGFLDHTTRIFEDAEFLLLAKIFKVIPRDDNVIALDAYGFIRGRGVGFFVEFTGIATHLHVLHPVIVMVDDKAIDGDDVHISFEWNRRGLTRDQGFEISVIVKPTLFELLSDIRRFLSQELAAEQSQKDSGDTDGGWVVHNGLSVGCSDKKQKPECGTSLAFSETQFL